MSSANNSQSPVVMKDTLASRISDSAWYVKGMQVAVVWDPVTIKSMDNSKKEELYENRIFIILCAINKKVEIRPTMSKLLDDLILVSVDGHKVNFRRPQLHPPPPGASVNLSKDKSVSGYDWKYLKYEWNYNQETGLYSTEAAITGAWSKFCYRGTTTYTYYQ